MYFLIDANLPRSTINAIRDAGHEAIDVRDIGLRAAADSEIAAYAKSHSFAIVTRDYDFADIRNYPPHEYAGLVVLELPEDAAIPAILGLVTSFLTQPDLLRQLPGRLAIVEPGRVRLRPA
jgi:hypothetical protein